MTCIDLLRTLAAAILAVALLPAASNAQTQAECTEEVHIIACFAPEQYTFRPWHGAQIERLAGDIAFAMADSDADRFVYTVTGHAATWRDMTQLEYIRNSFGRALVVANALREELRDEYDLRPDRVRVTVATASNHEPRPGMGYDTQRTRALQRRAEVLGYPEYDVDVPPRLDEALDDASTRRCHRIVLQHVRDPDKSPLYFPFNQVAEHFQGNDYLRWHHRVIEQDMGRLLRNQWRRTRDIAEYDYEDRVQNLRSTMNGICRDVNDLIRYVHLMECENPNVVAFRADLFARADEPGSIYGRAPYKARLKRKMEEMAMFGMFRPEVACPA